MSYTPARLLLAAALTGSLLSACATTPASGEPASEPKKPAAGANSAFPVVYDDWGRLGYRLDWVGFPFAPSEASARVVTASIYPDAVLVQNSTSTTSLMESSTGQVRWSTELTGPLTKWTGVSRELGDAGRLLVSSESELFLLAVGTGNLVGREKFERVINTPTILAGSTAIAGTSVGVVQAHLVGRDVSAWNFGSRGAIDAPLTQVGDFIAAVSQGGDVLFFSDKGDLVGRGSILSGVDTAPATDGNMLFIAGRDQSVWAFDTSGQPVWRFRTTNPLAADPVWHNGTLYCDIGALGLTAFDAASGVVRWHAKEIHGKVVAVRAGRLLVWDGKGLTVVDPQRGDRVDRVELPGVSRLIPLSLEDTELYAISTRNVVAKFITK
ncbi:MAG: PQQ-binding-like beta-propeller repeat protein [Phycisphaerales bacterium]